MKKWCRHILWQPKNFLKLKDGYHWWSIGVITVPRSWKMCPVCGTTRPRYRHPFETLGDGTVVKK